LKHACASREVAVIGGANSAGQAALYLAGRGGPVTLVVRGDDLSAGMSSYLADRILAHPSISAHTSTEVSALSGDGHLETISLRRTGDATRPAVEQACTGLFCFIGAVPATDWLDDVALDDHGFVLTDTELDSRRLGTVWETLGRRPLPFETNHPGIFAIGDARAGSMKRVAAAVGEGASAVRSVHAALGSVGV
jgi:thioredoxin reductase (NADPH)